MSHGRLIEGRAYGSTDSHTITTGDLYAMAWKVAQGAWVPRYLDREDLVQEGVEYAYKRVGDWTPGNGASLATWCYANCGFGVKRAVRKYQWGRTALEHDPNAVIEREPTSLDGVADSFGMPVAELRMGAVEDDQTVIEVEESLWTLSPREREAVSFVMLGFSDREGGAAMNISGSRFCQLRTSAGKKLVANGV